MFGKCPNLNLDRTDCLKRWQPLSSSAWICTRAKRTKNYEEYKKYIRNDKPDGENWKVRSRSGIHPSLVRTNTWWDFVDLTWGVIMRYTWALVLFDRSPAQGIWSEAGMNYVFNCWNFWNLSVSSSRIKSISLRSSSSYISLRFELLFDHFGTAWLIRW